MKPGLIVSTAEYPLHKFENRVNSTGTNVTDSASAVITAGFTRPASGLYTAICTTRRIFTLTNCMASSVLLSI